jgi:chromosome segregation ATPase
VEKNIENMTLEELKVYEEELKGQVPSDVVELNRVRDQIAQLEAKQVRIQEQEVKVASITLPHNFNEVFDDPRANDIIIEVIKDFQRQAIAEHNAEVESLIAQHREEIRTSSEHELQLKRKNEELQQENNLIAADRDQSKERLQQLSIELTDALSKRDAAVRDKEASESLLAEKQTHIDTLRNEIAIGASKAINVTNINPSDRLAQLIEQSKSAKIKSAAELALESATPFRGKVLVDGVVAPLSVPEVPIFQPEHIQAGDHPHTELGTQTDATTPAVDAVDHFRPEEVQAVPAPVAIGTSSENGQGTETVTRAEFETLKGKVDHLYRHANISEVA